MASWDGPDGAAAAGALTEVAEGFGTASSAAASGGLIGYGAAIDASALTGVVGKASGFFSSVFLTSSTFFC